MRTDIYYFIDKLRSEHSLTLQEYKILTESFNETNAEIFREEADKERRAYYGNKIFIRGLIEIGNICKMRKDTGLLRKRYFPVWTKVMSSVL